MLNKGKEKVQERPSKKRSNAWDGFTEVELPDGNKKAKCNNCEKLLSCNSKKHGTSQLRRHLQRCLGTEPPNKDARTTLRSYSSGNRENQLGYLQQTNTEPSGYLENNLGENNLGYVQQTNKEASRNRENQLRYFQQTDTEPFGSQENNLGENHLGLVQQINTKPSRCQENHLEYDPQKNRELFVRMVIDNKSMLEHVENPFLEEFARFLQPLYSYVTRRDVEEDCLIFYKNEKAKLKEKITKLNSKVSFSVAQCYNPKDYSVLLCVTAHFIDNDFKLIKRTIGFVEYNDVLPRYYYVQRIQEGLGLGEKVFACTMDERDNYFEKNFCPTLDPKCIVDSFRSIAWYIFDEIIGSYMYGIERMMKDLNEFPERMCYFNEIAAKHNLAPKLEFLVDNEGILGCYLNILNDACTYKKVLCKLNYMNIGWCELEEVVCLLNGINVMVETLSSHEFPTSNLFLKYVFEIRDLLESSVLSGESLETLNESLTILNGYLVSCNNMVLIASLLDPRFKFRLLEQYFKEAEDNKILLENFFCNLYSEYDQSQSTEIYRFDSVSQIPELKRYLDGSSVEEGDENFDVLGWWKESEPEYPILSRMARDILAIPISSSITSSTEPVEEIIDEIFCSTVDTEMSKVLVCCNNWLRSGKFVAGIENIEKRHVYQAFPEHSNKSNSCVYDQIKCLKLLAKLVISSELPFDFVQSTCFIEWAKNLQPLYTLVDLATIRAECLSLYQIESGRFKHLHEKTFVNSAHLERVCFSVHKVTKYVCVTAHFIDNDFNLVRRIIGIKIIRNWRPLATLWIPPVIIAQLQRCIDNWELPRKVLAFTTEKFSNEHHEKILNGMSYGVGAIKLDCIVQGFFGELLRFIFNELHPVFESIRKMIKFLAKAPNRMDTLNQLAMEPKILQLDDHRRWDSTLNMLSDAHAYKDVLVAYKGYNKKFPLFTNWNKVESAIKLLKQIYEAIIILSSSQYPTSNLFLKIVFEIHDVLSHIVFDTNNVIDKGKFLDCLKKIADSYLKDCNSILLIASLLDPQFKLTYLDRCYMEHISNISNIEEIKKCIGDLCIKFEIEHGPGMLELDRYLQEDHVEVRDDIFDVLAWWKSNQTNYPLLSRMARDILAIPVSSLSSESAFSTKFITGYSNFFRFRKLENKLGPRTLEALVCSYNWMSAASSNGICVQKEATNDCHIRSVRFLKHGLRGRMLEEIVAIGDARLTAEKMQCLIKSIDDDEINRWIPDEVINCYIGIMNNQGSTSGNILRLSTFDSQLLLLWALSMEKREELCERTLSNIVEKGNGFLQNDLVFLPIHEQNHWFVGVLNAFKKEFQILNSLNSGGDPHKETIQKLLLGIQVCIDAALDSQGTSQAWRPKINNWPISVISNLPQQKDGCSCGLFALKYMQLWDGSKLATEFTQNEIDLFRKQLVGELIFSELNEKKNIQEEIKNTKFFTQEPTESEESEESEEYEESEESNESAELA